MWLCALLLFVPLAHADVTISGGFDGCECTCTCPEFPTTHCPTGEKISISGGFDDCTCDCDCVTPTPPCPPPPTFNTDDCTCTCECPETTCPPDTTVTTPTITTETNTPPPTSCVPEDVCEFLYDGDEFDACFSKMPEEILAGQRDDCYKASQLEGDALQNLVDNLEAVCLVKFKVTLDIDISSSCTTLAPTTTVCVPTDVCDVFVGGFEFEVCFSEFHGRMLQRMKDDCAAVKNMGEKALQDFLDNMELLCFVKHDVEINIEPGVVCPTTPGPTTTEPTTTEPTTTEPTTTPCEPEDPCTFLYDDYFDEMCFNKIHALIHKKIIGDCDRLRNNLTAVIELIENIELICEIKTNQDVHFPRPQPCPETTTTPPIITTPPNPCNGQELDIVFIMDSSNSMGETRFEQVKDVVREIVLKLDISATLTRVGFIEFSKHSRRWLELGALNDKTAILDVLDTIDDETLTTNTHLAIKDFTDMLTQHSRPDAVKIGAILTDGRSTDYDELLASLVVLFHTHPDAKLIVVSVDDPVDFNALQPSEMRAMATGFGDENLIQVTNFDALSGIFENYRTLICDPNPVDEIAGCTQYVVMNTTDTSSDGDLYRGVYEINEAMGMCYGKPIYQHTSDKYWLSLLYSSWDNQYNWAITFTNPQDGSCNMPEAGTFAAAEYMSSSPVGQRYFEVALQDFADMQILCLF